MQGRDDGGGRSAAAPPTPDEALVWLHGEVRTPPFPTEARREVGHLLRLLQQGEALSLPHSRPMFPAIGVGCRARRMNAMDEAKRRRLEAAGYRVGTADEFLGLSAEESALIGMKLALRGAVRARREALGLTQAELAERLGSSQSRVAKLEGVDPAVSLDLLVRALLALGASREDVSSALGSDGRRAA